MSLATTLDYEATPVRKTTRDGVMVIDCMPTHRIIGFVAYRHRVGLLFMSNTFLIGFFVWEKVGRLFF